jgi:hypothetical protein
MRDVIQVTCRGECRLAILFDDGVEGEVDIAAMVPFEGDFSPLKDPKFFRQVRLNDELGVIRWPNGAKLDSDLLYAAVTGQPA